MMSSGGVELLNQPEEQDRFITQNWRRFAALAWERYLAEGRGALIIDISKAERGRMGFNLKSFYFAEGSEALYEISRQNDETAQAVAAYIPEREVVFVFRQSNGGIKCYRVSRTNDLTPVQAYQAEHGGAPIESSSN
jgi:hypothetical protein